MIFEQYIKSNKTEFLSKLKRISALLLADPEDLMAVMFKESGLNPQAYNPDGGASGLIQFMPATARALGTTTEALRNMSNVGQLDYVYKYYKPYTGKIKSFADAYSITFFPIMLGKPDSYILQTSTLTASRIAKSNPTFNLNKDQQITAGEFRTAIYKILPAEIAEYLKKKVKP